MMKMRIQDLPRDAQTDVKRLLKQSAKPRLELREIESRIKRGIHVAQRYYDDVWNALQKIESDIDFFYRFSWGLDIELRTYESH